MINFPDRVIEMLRGCPGGLTTKDLAARLGTTAGNISSRLSKLAAYGIIGTARRGDRGSRGNVYQASSGQAPQRTANSIPTLR
jgi:hypothetical protein